jgi:tripartite-type tricarboxylate transporter receptor subunit TctC
MAMKYPGILKGDFEPHFTMANMWKDSRYALALAESAGVNLPAITAVSARMGEMCAEGSGELDFSVEVLASAAPHLRDGTSRALAVTVPRRHPLFPDVPSVAEFGLTDVEITTWNVLLAPRGLPPALLARLNETLNAALAEPALRDRMAAAGVDAAQPSTPEETRAFVAAELAKFRAIVRDANIQLGR